ncbi:MAG TPA: DegT/DnrJ/EryC1/StrS family aminotransferase, partial [Luteolibacter sp.]
GCIARTGAAPVFCDVRADDFTIDLESAASRVTSRTKAILPVHLFGQCCDMDAVREFAARFGLKVIEDCAQSIGATFKDVQCGNFGEFGCFSFFPSKNLGGFGDGGLVTTNDDALAETVVKLRNHGMHPRYYHEMVGGNFRMDALQCALLRVKLRQLASYAEGRARNAAWYAANLPLPDGCRLPAAQPDRGHVWNQFTLRVSGAGRRDALKAHLSAAGIGCEIYYPVPLHRQECFADLPAAPCPVSDALAEEVLSIPIYPELVQNQLEEVAAAFASFRG